MKPQDRRLKLHSLPQQKQARIYADLMRQLEDADWSAPAVKTVAIMVRENLVANANNFAGFVQGCRVLDTMLVAYFMSADDEVPFEQANDDVSRMWEDLMFDEDAAEAAETE